MTVLGELHYVVDPASIYFLNKIIDIRTCHEGLSSSFKDDGSHFRIGICLHDLLVQLAHQFLIDGIHCFRAVEYYSGYAVLDLQIDN